jgi:hypothetical protein
MGALLYLYAKRVPGDIAHNVDEERIIAAYSAWWAALGARRTHAPE